MKKLLILLASSLSVVAQPSLPVMTRQVVWTQPSTSNVGGYVLTWGTNRAEVPGHLTQSTVIKLNPGVNEVVIRSVNGNAQSDPVTNRIMFVLHEFESSTNGGTSWFVRSNYTHAINNYKPTEMFRSKMKVNW